MGSSGRVPDMGRARQRGQPEKEGGAEKFGFSQIQGLAQKQKTYSSLTAQTRKGQCWSCRLLARISLPARGRTQIAPELSELVMSPSDSLELLLRQHGMITFQHLHFHKPNMT